MEKMKNPKEDSYKRFTEFLYKMNNAIHIKFYIRVNDIGHPIYFLKSGQQTLTIPGAGYAVKGPKVGALTGGGEENATDAYLILLGKQKVSVKKEDNGATSVNVENNSLKVFHTLPFKTSLSALNVIVNC